MRIAPQNAGYILERVVCCGCKNKTKEKMKYQTDEDRKATE
jgi:hypothetical protein